MTARKEEKYNEAILNRSESISSGFLEKHLTLLKDEYGEVFTDLGLINEKGIQFAY
jgi:two-component system, NtrC family, sensor kinase